MAYTETMCTGKYQEAEPITDSRGKCPRCDYVGRLYWKGDAGYCHVGYHEPIKTDKMDEATGKGGSNTQER